MGRNLLLNIADHGFSAAGYDKDLSKVEALRRESKERDVRGAAGITEIIALLRQPRAMVNGEPCVTWLGPGSAGHFVKMVHNGIEYGVMQLIAETYDLMKRSTAITTLFLDIGGVLLNDGWNHRARKRAASTSNWTGANSNSGIA